MNRFSLGLMGLLAFGCGGDGKEDPPEDLVNVEPLPPLDDAPPAGNEPRCQVPAEAALEDVSNPTTVVGDGTAASCTGDAFIDAVAQGGVITSPYPPEPDVRE